MLFGTQLSQNTDFTIIGNITEVVVVKSFYLHAILYLTKSSHAYINPFTPPANYS